MNLNEPRELASLLEAFLLASGKPQGLDRLYELFEEAERPDPPVFKKALEVLRKSCDNRAFELVEVASGYRLQIREKFAPWVGRLWEERPQRYSRAMLETLALIAYRQPITRGEIEDVRGVAVNSNIVKTLLEREWIRVVGYRDVPGRPAMFATTKAFLDHFNLKNLDDLPPMAALRELEPEPLLDVEDAPVPAHLQALADASLGEDGEDGEPEPPRDETSFRTLLVELDAMELGLKTDFEDLRVDEVGAETGADTGAGAEAEAESDAGAQAGGRADVQVGAGASGDADADTSAGAAAQSDGALDARVDQSTPPAPVTDTPAPKASGPEALYAQERASVAAAREALKALYQRTLDPSDAGLEGDARTGHNDSLDDEDSINNSDTIDAEDSIDDNDSIDDEASLEHRADTDDQADHDDNPDEPDDWSRV